MYKGLTHSCVAECQACYVFTLDNLLLIAEDESATPWAEDASVELRPVESYKRNQSLLHGQIDNVRIHFQDPFNLGSSSYGIQQHVFHQHSVDLGIHTTIPELKGIIPKTPASPQVATPELFQEIEQWIADCLENHIECPTSIDTLLPTRVLDVGTDAHSPSEDVSLHISSTGECGRYVALSYCWGIGTQTRTLKQNLAEHMRYITVSSLPQTIQDAIRVTRELKVRYLWVDALCIIQDSFDDDWPREAGRMPEIYKNAVVTISAAAAVDSHQGFLEDRQAIFTSQMQASRFPVYKFGSNDGDEEGSINATDIGEVFITQDAELGYSIKEFDEENINTRAWTLQEMWLAPRLVSFGTGLPQWICLKHEKIYGVDQSNPRYSWDKMHEVRRQIFTEASSPSNNTSLMVSGQLDRTDYLQEWSSLFTKYSRRELTVKTDKMVAISGIAREFEKLLNDQYVAGLWRSSLPEALLWHNENQWQEERRSKAKKREKKRKRDKILAFLAFRSSKPSNSSLAAEPYIAPSWSPFANDGSVRCFHTSCSDLRTLCVINDLQVEPENALAPFLTIKPGQDWIDVTAPMAQMSYEELITYFVIVTEGTPHMYWDWIIPDGGVGNEHIGPAAKLQIKHPEINPQILVDANRITSMLGGSPPLVRETSPRPIPPPPSTTDSWPRPTYEKKRTRGAPDVDFWLLEIDHGRIPTGLLLIRLHSNRFKRIGMFNTGRNQSTTWEWRNGLEISGPRRWDWDSRLAMRSCIIN
ncbi:hypothetical protein N0V82_001754 [Gnomoniopsis sp. IMI 355080]|nr:hypothetical protein N0V82_001754 [Gnomoniopsis sp. IMI 355080]